MSLFILSCASKQKADLTNLESQLSNALLFQVVQNCCNSNSQLFDSEACRYDAELVMYSITRSKEHHPSEVCSLLE